MKRVAQSWKLLAALTLAHVVATVFAVMMVFGGSRARFDDPELEPTAFDAVMEIVATVLLFPLAEHWPLPAPGLLGYVPLTLNGLLWAVVLTWLWSLVRGRATSGASA